jgi:hypothetical protein
MEWRDALRANLSLWPNLAPNLAAIGLCAGENYSSDLFFEALSSFEGQASIDLESAEESLAEAENSVEATEDSSSIPLQGKSKKASTDRTIRNTVEVMALGGLAFVEDESVHLTRTGKTLLRFLSSRNGVPSIANNNNIHLAGKLLLPGLMAVPEYRAILMLIDSIDNYISPEELNRAIGVMIEWDYPHEALMAEMAIKIKQSRFHNDVASIGQRWYKNEDFGTVQASSQRKALNPWFLLSGGGGLVLQTEANSTRRIHPLLRNEICRLRGQSPERLKMPAKDIFKSSKSFAMAFSDLCV